MLRQLRIANTLQIHLLGRHASLIDDENDMLKSKGKNKKGDLSNPDKEHLSIKTFDGDLNDRELKEGEQGWELVFDYIHNIFNM